MSIERIPNAPFNMQGTEIHFSKSARPVGSKAERTKAKRRAGHSNAGSNHTTVSSE